MSMSSGCHFVLQMTTGWHAHLVYIFFQMWTGWGCRPVVISKTKWESDKVHLVVMLLDRKNSLFTIAVSKTPNQLL